MDVRIGTYTSNNLSIPQSCNISILQSCILCLLLYSLFTHDCAPIHNMATIIQFADDITANPFLLWHCEKHCSMVCTAADWRESSISYWSKTWTNLEKKLHCFREAHGIIRNQSYCEHCQFVPSPLETCYGLVSTSTTRLRNIFLPRAGLSDLSSVLVTTGPLTTHPAHENKGC